MSEPAVHIRQSRGRGTGQSIDGRRPLSRNKQWVAGERSATNTPRSDGERWQRGGHRGGRGLSIRGAGRGAGRKAPGVRPQESNPHTDNHVLETDAPVVEDPEFETQEERDKFYQELVKAREVERKKAIAEGKMDDPLIPKRLEDAITMVGTCMDMCPRFERYRREKENNLFEWETIQGTKRVDHKLAVKAYERAAGDKTLPSDLRPPQVLKRTLDYLFHDLLLRGGFSATYNFIRDRSRAVRNDFTMQHETGPLAIECHDRCARFHIIALHLERDTPGFSIAMEEQQLMNTLQSLKEFYHDQRGKYQSPTELEMRVYHRLIHIRDQKERPEDIPDHITAHPVFKLTTDFRLHVQNRSAPISKTSPLIVDAEGMQIFGELAAVLREQGSVVMIYLVACILERLFGKDAIDDIESLRGNLEIPDIIDGVAVLDDAGEFEHGFVEEVEDEMMDAQAEEPNSVPESSAVAPTPLRPSATEWLANNFNSSPPAIVPTSSEPPLTSIPRPPATSAFSGLASKPNAFNPSSVFGSSAFTVTGQASKSVFGSDKPSAFGNTSTSDTPSTGAPFSVPSLFPASNSLVSGPTIQANTSAGTSNAFLTPGENNSQVNGVASSLFASPSTNPLSGFSLNPQAAPFTPNFFPTNVDSVKTISEQPTSSSAPSAISTNVNGFHPIKPAESMSTTKPSSLPRLPNTLPAWTQPSSSKSSTPPPLPKLDTATLTSLAKEPSRGQDSLPSPRVPPPLNRIQPISLPSTPTLSQPPRPHLGFLRNSSLQTPPSGGYGSEILSPLILQSPSLSRAPTVPYFTPHGTPGSEDRPTVPTPPLSPPKLNGIISSSSKGKGKEKEKAASGEDVEPSSEEISTAIAFARKGVIVQQCFHYWQERTTDRAAWLEACRNSEAYQRKIHESKERDTERNGVVVEQDRKRRASKMIGTEGAEPPSPVKKRAKKRISSEYRPPRSDEELARRLKGNREEYDRRWTRGSFLTVLQSHVRNRRTRMRDISNGIFNGRGKITDAKDSDTWCAWLSMNPDIDATAIWLEHKFDIPASGWWENELVFSIPVDPKDANRRHPNPFTSQIRTGHPGLIMFECTPLEGVGDELDRKYRVLDDCTRLRDIIKSLPPARHFVPSLLILYWEDSNHTEPGEDLMEMVKRYISDSVLSGHYTFSFTSATQDIESKFGEVLRTLTLDTEGQLVQLLSLRGVFHLFDPQLRTFISEWVGNCLEPGECNWRLLTHIIHACVALLNHVSAVALQLTGLGLQTELLPSFNEDREVSDNQSFYDLVLVWLTTHNFAGAADNAISDIQSHRSLGHEFPARAFVEHLNELVLRNLEAHIQPEPSAAFHVLKADIKSSLEEISRLLGAQSQNLMEKLSLTRHRSPSRHSISPASETDRNLLLPASKRIRLSDSYDQHLTTMVNGRSSPSPSASSVSAPQADGSVITIAMLKTLTRDVKQKYGISK